MTPGDFQIAFDEAQKKAIDLQKYFSEAAQSAGQISSVLLTTKPYWTQLAQQADSDPNVGPALMSGIAMVREIGNSLPYVDTPDEPYSTMKSVALSASTFASNTAATSSLLTLKVNNGFQVEAIPVPDFSQERTLATRFSKLDPALGKVTAEIWETLYGTSSDAERSALYMVRQTWDHFFDCLAPDQKVRQSSFWVKKDGDKADMVTREERFKYAVEFHVKDDGTKKLLLVGCEQMLDLYQELNRAHKRGEIDRIKARRSLNSMYTWLAQWADALEL